MGDEKELISTQPQQLTREQILEKARERLIARDEKYLEGLADMDVKLVVAKIKAAVIEQGRLVKTHQLALEDQQIVLDQTKKAAKEAIDEADRLREENKEIRGKMTINNKAVRKMVDIIEAIHLDAEKEKKSRFSYKFKAFFKKLFGSEEKHEDLRKSTTHENPRPLSDRPNTIGEEE